MPGDDREWTAAAGANGYYLSYHAEFGGDEIIVNQRQVVDGQPATVQTYDAINPAQTDIYLGTVEDNEIGNIAVDPTAGNVYQARAGRLSDSPVLPESARLFRGGAAAKRQPKASAARLPARSRCGAARR